MSSVLDQYRRAKVILTDERDSARKKVKRYLKRIGELVSREREQRRRVEHLMRSLAAATDRVRAQSATLYRKDLKAMERNREIRILCEFKATLETAFPNIEENIQTIQKSLGDIDIDDTTNTTTGDDLG